MAPNEQYNLLIESLLLAAASASEQVSALPDFVVVTDEVASTFGDAFLLVPQLERAGLASRDAVTTLQELDEHFKHTPDDTIASPSSLHDHPYWEKARRLATDALAKLGEEKRPPKLQDATWIRG